MSLFAWSWMFLIVYIVGMLAFGWIASRRISNADDFATARSSYGPYFLALAFAATTASGATFLGSPGLGYQFGMASVWGKFLYPMGVYFGVLITIKLVANSGHKFGNRSIPEYLGDRYQSDGVRLLVSVFSLVLFFYIAGQLVSGLVMFEIMLGLKPMTALIITSGVLLVYVVLGGAHADILTDGIQGLMMLLVAIVVIVMFLGRRPRRARLQPARPGRASGRAAQHVEFALRLLVGHRLRAVRPHSARHAAPHRQQGLGAQERRRPNALRQARLRRRPDDGNARSGRHPGPRRPRPGASRGGAQPERGSARPLAGRSDRRRHPGRDHVDRGRARRVVVPDRRQRHLPPVDRPQVQPPSERQGSRPQGPGDQPLEHGDRPDPLYLDGLGDAGHEHRPPGLGRHRGHDGCLRGSAGCRRVVAWRHPRGRLHRAGQRHADLHPAAQRSALADRRSRLVRPPFRCNRVARALPDQPLLLRGRR
ncbi:MAG: hypothetical protein J4F98_14965 [Acidobacteria bacterium]|nr:hypothetical protein [Acidobacteriota bacterium]